MHEPGQELETPAVKVQSTSFESLQDSVTTSLHVPVVAASAQMPTASRLTPRAPRIFALPKVAELSALVASMRRSPVLARTEAPVAPLSVTSAKVDVIVISFAAVSDMSLYCALISKLEPLCSFSSPGVSTSMLPCVAVKLTPERPTISSMPGSVHVLPVGEPDGPSQMSSVAASTVAPPESTHEPTAAVQLPPAVVHSDAVAAVMDQRLGKGSALVVFEAFCVF